LIIKLYAISAKKGDNLKMNENTAKQKFIVSCDSSADLFERDLIENDVYCLVMTYIQDGKEVTKLFKNSKELDLFYEDIKEGARPSTAAINPTEYEEYFTQILQSNPDGDILHITLSSGLSLTWENAVKVASEMNAKLENRKIVVVDSLIATHGIAQLIDIAIECRDAGNDVDTAAKKVEYVRDHQQGWVVVTDLFHLKRGGRISGVKAALGTLLGVKPIVIVAKNGKLAIQNKIKGQKKAINYILDKVDEMGVKAREDFYEHTVYLVKSSTHEVYDEFKAAFKERFPKAKIKEGQVGTIVGTHLGGGCAVVIFQGAKRLDI